MKRVLITGAGSYIGTSLAAHLEKFDGEYAVSTLDMQTDAWKNADFSPLPPAFIRLREKRSAVCLNSVHSEYIFLEVCQ